METLASYRSGADLTQAALARRLQISRSYLNEIEAGKKKPGLELALRIESETQGRVSTRSWFSDSAPVPGADASKAPCHAQKRERAEGVVQGGEG